MIMYIMAFGAALGGLDYILGNRWGLGAKFEEGFQCLGPTAFSMVGILCLVPPFTRFFGPMAVSVFRAAGADPAMFGSLLAIDMGGYSLAMELAEDVRLGWFSGLVVSAMFGAAVVFAIPVGFGIIEKSDREYFARGILIGLVPIPAGALAGGVIMGMDVHTILVNLMPCILVGGIMAMGLFFARERAVKAFLVFGRLIQAVAAAGLAASAVEYMAGVAIIPGMLPVMEGMETAGKIAVVLLGSLPVMELILRLLDRPFRAASRRLGLDAASAAGLLFSCVSVLPVYRSLKEMCPRGKVVVTAASVSLISVFAAHLGFTAQAEPRMLAPMILSKLISGCLAAVLAYAVTGRETFR